MQQLPLVSSPEEAVQNIDRFEAELAISPGLRDRLSHVHAWYAHRRPNGSWVFGPSKFVGYRDNTADQYLSTYSREGGAHGSRTEAALKAWFGVVDAQSPLGRELHRGLSDFLSRWQALPRKSVRIGVLKPHLDPLSGGETGGWPDAAMSARISIDPRVCGGRPCIRGTRMRVSDIIGMMAQGAAHAEILADFPYLSQEDLAAALAYAARATDHRVFRAA